MAHHEAKLIWGDVSRGVPDLVVSIGTGTQLRDHQVVRPSNGRTSRATQASSGSSVHSSNQPHGGRGTMHVPSVLGTTSTGSQRLSEYKECDRQWNRFMSSSTHQLGPQAEEGISASEQQHYIRISPELLIPIPKFDQIQKMDDIEQEAEEVLYQMPEVWEIAHRLIASTFFFEKNPGSIRQTATGFMCTGKFSK